MASCWNGSSWNLYVLAGSRVVGLRGTYSWNETNGYFELFSTTGYRNKCARPVRCDCAAHKNVEIIILCDITCLQYVQYPLFWLAETFHSHVFYCQNAYLKLETPALRFISFNATTYPLLHDCNYLIWRNSYFVCTRFLSLEGVDCDTRSALNQTRWKKNYS